MKSNNFNLIKDATSFQLNNKLPLFSSGDTIIVEFKIKDGNKFRIQNFEGIVIKTQGKDISKTVTVRTIFNGVGIERVFPIHSPLVENIKVVKKGKVRQSRIYYIRNLSGKSARIKEDLRKK